MKPFAASTNEITAHCCLRSNKDLETARVDGRFIVSEIEEGGDCCVRHHDTFSPAASVTVAFWAEGVTPLLTLETSKSSWSDFTNLSLAPKTSRGLPPESIASTCPTFLTS